MKLMGRVIGARGTTGAIALDGTKPSMFHKQKESQKAGAEWGGDSSHRGGQEPELVGFGEPR